MEDVDMRRQIKRNSGTACYILHQIASGDLLGSVLLLDSMEWRVERYSVERDIIRLRCIAHPSAAVNARLSTLHRYID
jgi:hypothetical protein